MSRQLSPSFTPPRALSRTPSPTLSASSQDESDSSAEVTLRDLWVRATDAESPEPTQESKARLRALVEEAKRNHQTTFCFLTTSRYRRRYYVIFPRPYMEKDRTLIEWVKRQNLSVTYTERLSACGEWVLDVHANLPS